MAGRRSTGGALEYCTVYPRPRSAPWLPGAGDHVFPLPPPHLLQPTKSLFFNSDLSVSHILNRPALRKGTDFFFGISHLVSDVRLSGLESTMVLLIRGYYI